MTNLPLKSHLNAKKGSKIRSIRSEFVKILKQQLNFKKCNAIKFLQKNFFKYLRKEIFSQLSHYSSRKKLVIENYFHTNVVQACIYSYDSFHMIRQRNFGNTVDISALRLLWVKL